MILQLANRAGGKTGVAFQSKIEETIASFHCGTTCAPISDKTNHTEECKLCTCGSIRIPAIAKQTRQSKPKVAGEDRDFCIWIDLESLEKHDDCQYMHLLARFEPSF